MYLFCFYLYKGTQHKRSAGVDGIGTFNHLFLSCFSQKRKKKKTLSLSNLGQDFRHFRQGTFSGLLQDDIVSEMSCVVQLLVTYSGWIPFSTRDDGVPAMALSTYITRFVVPAAD